MSHLRPRYIVFIVSIILMISGISTAWCAQNNFGTVQATEITLTTAEGVAISSILQKPHAATSSTPLPGVVVIHGIIQSKEWVMAFGIELARRGFVVLTIDAVGHGNSGPSAGTGTDDGGIAALEYLNSLSYVSTLGMVGHSMGAGIAIQAINDTSIQVDSLVLVGGGGSNITNWANASYPQNVLFVVGLYDELFSVPELLADLAGSFNTTGPVIPGQLYGNFAMGTARKIILPPTNHLFETIDAGCISSTTEWLMNSLKGGPDAYWIPSQFLLYPLWIAGGVLSCLGAVLSIFALFTIIIKFSIFREIQHTPNSPYFAGPIRYLGLGLVYGMLGLGSILAMLAVYLPISYPQIFGLQIILGLFAGGIVAFLLIIGIKLLLNRKEKTLTWNDFGGFNGKEKTDYRTMLKRICIGFLLGFIGIAWLYLWTLPVDIFLALDFRVFLPFLKILSPLRVLFVPLYFFLLIPVSLVDGLWLMGILRTQPKDNWWKTQIWWTSKAIFIKVLVMAVILIVQTGVSIAIGGPFISGFMGFYLLFLWVFIPQYTLSTALLAWSYRLSNRFYISTLFNALLNAWFMAAILPIYI
ncbi:MAG: dienelactone hydrolase family protein [Promethearchaeota archaeon]